MKIEWDVEKNGLGSILSWNISKPLGTFICVFPITQKDGTNLFNCETEIFSTLVEAMEFGEFCCKEQINNPIELKGNGPFLILNSVKKDREDFERAYTYMRLNQYTQPVAQIETESGRKVNVYPSSFNFPHDPFTTYWVAKDDADNCGFLIDGKALCFHQLDTSEYEFIAFTPDLSWLDTLRKFAPV